MRAMSDLEIAVAAARAGAAVVLDWVGKIGDPSFKGLVDPVTEADKAAEEAVLDVLRKHRPADGILAEEGGVAESTSGRRWLVDPLDGTVNYIHGLKHSATSVALEGPNGMLAAATIDPFRGEEFTAACGEGAFLNGKPMHVSSRAVLREALMVTGFAYDRADKARVYTDALAAVLAEVQGVRRLGSATLDLAWVACGRYEGYWEFRLAPWDLAAGSLLVIEAGGTVTDSRGGPARPEDVVATNGLLHEDLRSIVTGYRPDEYLPR